MHFRQSGFAHPFLLAVVFAVLAGIGFAGWRVLDNQRDGGGGSVSEILASDDTALNKAVKAGKVLSNSNCDGTDKATFTNLPMRKEDFSLLIPYGLVVGGHVTPIDHQYFSPAVFDSPRNAYPVYAMADSRIVDISSRTNDRGTEYRLVFSYSCTFLYYYDLVTSLTGQVKEAYDKNNRDIDLTVKAGQQIGAIGGQTLDLAVWDTEKPVSGFIVPEHYEAEGWKLFTTDPYPYYTPELRALLIERNPRTVEPIAGKIDYDIDGKLIGNWFEQGTGGYTGGGGPRGMEYWTTHLSIAPDLYASGAFIVSLGDFGGQALQFAARGNSPDPATVGVETGLVKYSLQKYSFVKADGSPWDHKSVTKNPKLKNSEPVEGCLLVQLTGKRLLKAESFPKKNCSVISGFSSGAKTYER